MRFQVPQFVDIEDKVIGPLTLKQFAFYIIAAMILGILYVIVDLGLLILFALPIAGITVLFAHGRFYGQSSGTIFLNALSFFSSSRLYLWRRVENNQPIKVSGNEYGHEEEKSFTSSIDLMNQTLNTEGNVVEVDAADPLLDEGEAANNSVNNNTKEKRQSPPPTDTETK